MSRFLSSPVAALVAATLLVGAACAADTVWQSNNDFVRIVPAEAGTPPAAASSLPPLSPDAVRALLTSIRLTGEDGDTRYLDDDQVALVAEPVARALRSAGSGQDVVFAVHYVSPLSILGPPKSTAGRLFIDGNAVDLILGQVQSTFLSSFVSIDASRIRTGSRGAPQETRYRILAGGPVSLVRADRGDWARIEPAVWAGSYGMPVTPIAPIPAVTPTAAVPAAPPAAPPAPAVDPHDIEQRFAALKRLYDGKLITEADYERAKADLLKSITELSH